MKDWCKGRCGGAVVSLWIEFHPVEDAQAYETWAKSFTPPDYKIYLGPYFRQGLLICTYFCTAHYDEFQAFYSGKIDAMSYGEGRHCIDFFHDGICFYRAWAGTECSRSDKIILYEIIRKIPHINKWDVTHQEYGTTFGEGRSKKSLCDYLEIKED